jgi:hypothetical protein
MEAEAGRFELRPAWDTQQDPGSKKKKKRVCSSVVECFLLYARPEFNPQQK